MNTQSNKVYSVLVTKGDFEPLNRGTLEDLKDGQIGVFSDDTLLSLDGTETGVRDIFLAVGVHKDGELDTILTSAGQHISVKSIRAYNYKPHSASRPMKFQITDYKADCDKDYILKFEFRNPLTVMLTSNNGYSKIYSVHTSCCEGCEDCPSGSLVELTKLLYEELSNDPDGLFKVDYIKDGIVVTDQATIDAFTDEDNLGLEITVNGIKVNDFCNVPTSYYTPRQTVVIPSLLSGFSCNGKVTVTQQALPEEGSGEDIKYKEYYAGGWNDRPGPYRVSGISGLPFDGFKYYTDTTKKYDQVDLTYDLYSPSGFGEYVNSLGTLVAIPEEDTVTRDGLISILDKIFVSSNMQALTPSVATASTNSLVVEPQPTSYENDGIG